MKQIGSEVQSEAAKVEAKRPRGRIPGQVPFPRNSLKEALAVGQAIERDNAGQPYDPILLAKQSLGTTHRSSSFEVLLTSSERYGLTEGNSRAKTIMLMPTGSAIVAPTDESQVGANIRKALLTPKVFEQFYTRYDRKNVPKEEIIRNVLEKEFKVPRPDVDACYSVLMQNITDYDLIIVSGESRTLYLDKLAKATVVSEPSVQSLLKLPELEGEREEMPAAPIGEQLKPQEKAIPKLIFVAHGANKKPLEQLKTILTEFKVPFEVAIDEPHKGRAISDKVLQLMKQCTSGIFIFTGDEETTDADGNKVLRPSDNVVFELGAGVMQYGDKIVIFREEGVDFGSDFTSYGRITFEKNKLEAKGLELMKELISQGFLQVTPR